MRIPDSKNRSAIVGATGSGKTIAGLYQLALQEIDKRPYIIYNWKRDDNIDGIPHAHVIDLDEIPLEPGVYIVHPRPDDHDDVEAQMWQIYERENIGLLIDEGFMVAKNNKAFRAILTQGRSKTIPVITLSQRPVNMDRSVFTESEFFQVFRLQFDGDRKKVQEYIPRDITARLPKFHSYYYDVSEDTFHKLAPVPPIEDIYKTFDAKLKRLRRVA